MLSQSLPVDGLTPRCDPQHPTFEMWGEGGGGVSHRSILLGIASDYPSKALKTFKNKWKSI
jgi:hypothetical protein